MEDLKGKGQIEARLQLNTKRLQGSGLILILQTTGTAGEVGVHIADVAHFLKPLGSRFRSDSGCRCSLRYNLARYEQGCKPM